MNATIKEWITKAEGDYATAQRELHPQGTPNFDAVCFHAEQCAEKLMKALLIQLGVTPPQEPRPGRARSVAHARLPRMVVAINDLRLLTRAAVDFRYPGEAADKKEASEAFDIGTRMRAKLLTLLGVSP